MNKLIEKELKLSASIGMNTHRVFLHDLLWEQDSIGFLDRIDKFLEISDRNGIKTLFVFFDDVWHPVPKIGKQPEPIPHVHNSGWVQSPGAKILYDFKITKNFYNHIIIFVFNRFYFRVFSSWSRHDCSYLR